MRFPREISRMVNFSRLHFGAGLGPELLITSLGSKNMCTFNRQMRTSLNSLSLSGFMFPKQVLVGAIKNAHSSRCLHLTANPICKKSRSSKNLPVQDDVIDEKEEDPDEDLDLLGKGDQVVRLRLPTDRLDAVLKAGLNLSRNKIEKAFYADRVRVNGERPKKKSQLITEGDEVDVVRRYNAKNPAHLDVSRLEILEMGTYSRLNENDDDDEAKIPVKVKRFKNLTIENYKVPVKGNLNED